MLAWLLPLAQGSEPIPAWRIWWWMAAVVSVIAVGYLVRMAMRPETRSRAGLTLALVLVIVLWGGYRVASDHRWKVNALSNEAIQLVEVDDTSTTTKFGLGSRGECGSHEVMQQTLITNPVQPDASGAARGSIGPATMELADSISNRLTVTGWTVRRLEVPNRVGELELLFIQASKNGEDSKYLGITIEPRSVRISAFTDPCLVTHGWIAADTPGVVEVDRFMPSN